MRNVYLRTSNTSMRSEMQSEKVELKYMIVDDGEEKSYGEKENRPYQHYRYLRYILPLKFPNNSPNRS